MFAALFIATAVIFIAHRGVQIIHFNFGPANR